MQIGTTLTKFIIEEERQHPEATGEFTGLLTDLASAAKIISRDVNKAGLAEVMGITGRKMEILDELSGIAPTSIVRALARAPGRRRICAAGCHRPGRRYRAGRR